MVTPSKTDKNLKSTKALDVAVELSNRWLGQIADAAGFNNPGLEHGLRSIRDLAWSLIPGTNQVTDVAIDKEARFKDVLDAFPGKDDKKPLLESYARLGHINEIAGIVARENYFEHCRAETEAKRDTPIPGGVNYFLNKLHEKKAAGENSTPLTVDDVLESIGKPIFEAVLTQHPTNVNALPFMQAQRALAVAVENKNKGVEGADAQLNDALTKFQEAAVIKTDEKGEPKNFTVRDEIDIITNYLDNLYKDVPRVFAQYDRPLQAEFKDQYNPEALKLNMRFASWGSAGDKDGNGSITAFNTLEAIALHSQAILTHYKNDLTALPGDDKKLGEWKNKISTTLGEVERITKDIVLLRERQEDFIKVGKIVPAIDSQKMDKKFDELSRELAAARKSLQGGEFVEKNGSLEQVLAEQYSATKDENALKLLRRVRTFGFTFAKIEYRETAEEYTRVAADILGEDAGYAKLSPEAQKDMLTKILKDSGTDLSTRFKENLERIYKTGAGKPYKRDDSLATSYNSLKRMQLARDHDDMIQNNVLAECGKLPDETPEVKALAEAQDALYAAKDEDREAAVAKVAECEKAVNELTPHQGVANLLEAQLLQRCVQKGNEKLAMGIVPLYEEPETMKNAVGIMRMAYANDAYKQHMQAFSDKYHGGKTTQQVQIAHSDTARRAGLQAARGFIHEAHSELRKLNDRAGIKTEIYEGGSLSDGYRNGLRCPSAMIDAFGTHDFAKFTFQGGDLLNFFNVPCATERLLTRNLSAQALGLEGLSKGHHDANSVMESVAIAALTRTFNDYEKEDFTQARIGKVVELLDYAAESKAGGATSRPTVKSAASGGSSAAEADSTGTDGKPLLKGTTIDKIRTIAFSESTQHAGLVISWVGSDHLLDYIGEEIVKKKAEIEARGGKPNDDDQEFMKTFEGVSKKEPAPTAEGEEKYTIGAEHIRALYKGSPAFRDAQDRAAFAVAMTNMDRVEKTVNKNLLKYSADSQRDNDFTQYFGHLKNVFKRAGWVAAAAHEATADEIGKTPDRVPPTYAMRLADHTYDTATQMETKEVTDLVGERLELMKDEMAIKRGYRSFGIHVKTEDNLGDYLRRVIHNAIDTVVHGRWLVGDYNSAQAIHEYNAKQAQQQTLVA